MLYRGRRLEGVNPHASIVFQTFALFPWLTVLENVEVALKARGIPPKMRTARALDLLDRIGLDGFETAYPRELSGGMRQKVGFARALAVEPELLCLDEPFSALDVLSAEALRGELLELWTSGKLPTRALLMVTHSIEEAVFMADRIVVMEKDPGRVVGDLKVSLQSPETAKGPGVPGAGGPGIRDPGRTDPVGAARIGDAPGGARQDATAAPRGHERTGRASWRHLVIIAGRPDGHLPARRGAEGELGPAARAHRRGGAAGLRHRSPRGISPSPRSARPLPRPASWPERRSLRPASRRLPFFRWLLAMLRAADEKRLQWDVVQKALELEFPPEEAGAAARDTAVNWGRYTELLAYEDNTGTIYLEPGGEA